MPLLWPSTNKEFLHVTVFDEEKQKEERKKLNGTCAALSALWLNNMLNGVDAEVSWPDIFRAQLLQAKYSREVGFEIPQIMSTIGLTMSDAKSSCMTSDAVKKMLQDKGEYFISVRRKHAVAAYVRGLDLYFYDSNSGLYCEEGAQDALKRITGLNYSETEIWDFYSVTR